MPLIPAAEPTPGGVQPPSSYNPGGITPQMPPDFIGPAIKSVGSQMGAATADLAYIGRVQQLIKDRNDQFDAQARATDFVTNFRAGSDEAIKTMQPNAVGLVKSREDAWNKGTDEFYKTVEPGQL